MGDSELCGLFLACGLTQGRACLRACAGVRARAQLTINTCILLVHSMLHTFTTKYIDTLNTLQRLEDDKKEESGGILPILTITRSTTPVSQSTITSPHLCNKQ